MKNPVIFILLLVITTVTQAQNVKSEQKEKKENPDSLFNESSRSFLPVPLIINNPAIKTGFGALLMYYFKFDQEDTLSPPSTINLYTLYSTNKSYIVMPAARFYWNRDRNRASVAPGVVNINNNFYYETDTGDLHLVYTEQRFLLTLEYSHVVAGNFYLGGLYLGTKTKYKFNQGTDEENDFTEDFFEKNGIHDNFVSSIGLNISFDSRDYVYYPSKGLMFSVRPKLNAYWLGSDTKYIDTDYNFAYYLSLNKKSIMAFNLAGGFAQGYGGDDVPFDGYQNYGIANSLRGYETGKYQGRNMIAVQAEYRWNFYRRWGAVFFAGTGSIWGNDSKEENYQTFAERKWLPAAGLGLRFMILRAKKTNLRLDYGWGVDGNQGLYFGVMEAF